MSRAAAVPKPPRVVHARVDATPALGARDVALVVATSLLAALPSLFWRFGRDQGIYAYTAWAWLHGDAPYRDVYVFKPPGTVFVHALAQALFGADMTAIRLLDMGVQAATAALLAGLVATWARDRSVGLWAGLLYGPAYYCYGFWHTAQTDGWFNPLAAAALLLVSRARGRLVAASVLAGLAVGVAVVLKYTALALGLPLVLAILRSPRGPEPAPPRRVAAAAACAAIPAPLLLTFGWMAAAGLFQGYLESQRLVLGYAANTMPDPLAFDWVRWVTQPEYRLGFPMLGLGLLAGLALTARGRRPRGLLVWGAWLLAAAASLVSQGRFFEYHSLPLVPLFAWAGAWLAAPLARWLDGWRRGLSAVLVLVLMLVHTTPSSWLRIGERIAGHAVALAGGPPVEVAPSRYERVAAVIRAHTDPHETVYVWTYDPVVMFLAERRQVSRFLYNYPMVVAWQDGRARRELLEALEEAPPAMFVVGSRDAAKHVTGNPHDSKRSFEAFTELRDWVDAHYRPLTEQDGFQFFVRRRQRGHEGPSKPRSGTPP